jgi:hypothetical protein
MYKIIVGNYVDGSGGIGVVMRAMWQLILQGQGSLADLQTGCNWARICVGVGRF